MPPPDAVFREITVDRLVLREPDTGRSRAVLETTPARVVEGHDQRAYPGVRLTLLDGAGDEEVVVELDEHGRPRVTIGSGRFSVVLTDRGLALWSGGNEVAVIDSRNGGQLELFDVDGKAVLQLP